MMDQATQEIPYPEAWIEQLKPLLGAQLPDFLDCLALSPARGIRMRPGRGPVAEAEGPVPWAENAWYLPLDSDAGARPAHEAGAYYLQEPSAMAAAAALHPLPGERALDLCAAPGGKSTQLAAYMAGQGVLVCNEPFPSRAKILSRNVERMGVKNAVVVSALPENLSLLWPAYFDRILVDAPCSGEGMFRRNPQARTEWSPASPGGCAQRQKHILHHAARMLRPGGRLVYSTCTFNELENEGVVEDFLREHPDFSPVPFQLPGLPPCQGTLRLWPHQVRGEGHFVALLEKREGEEARPLRPFLLPSPGKGEIALARDFLREQIAEDVIPNALFAGRIVQAPAEAPPLDKVKVLRLGLQIGECRGKLFFPDHALALACPPRKGTPLSPAEAERYQSGETLAAPADLQGFCVLTLEGLPLGWGKASAGQIKNHYPKGLRK